MDPTAKRLEELLDEVRKANQVLQAGKNFEHSPEYKEMQYNTRAPSKAAKIGMGPTKGSYDGGGQMRGSLAKRVAAGLYGGNRSKLGTIATAFLKMSGRDQDEWAEGKAMLIDAGFFRADLPALSRAYATSYGPLTSDDYSGGFSKATLGTTGTTGGYVLPNNLVLL